MKRIGIALCALWLAAPASAEAPAADAALMRADGSAIDYRIELRRPRARQPLLLMLQGSGCDSVARNDRIRWMAALLAPRHALLTIEKYGVIPGSDGASCSSERMRGNTLTRRVLDALQIVARLRRSDWWNGDWSCSAARRGARWQRCSRLWSRKRRRRSSGRRASAFPWAR